MSENAFDKAVRLAGQSEQKKQSIEAKTALMQELLGQGSSYQPDLAISHPINLDLVTESATIGAPPAKEVPLPTQQALPGPGTVIAEEQQPLFDQREETLLNTGVGIATEGTRWGLDLTGEAIRSIQDLYNNMPETEEGFIRQWNHGQVAIGNYATISQEELIKFRQIEQSHPDARGSYGERLDKFINSPQYQALKDYHDYQDTQKADITHVRDQFEKHIGHLYDDSAYQENLETFKQMYKEGDTAEAFNFLLADELDITAGQATTSLFASLVMGNKLKVLSIPAAVFQYNATVNAYLDEYKEANGHSPDANTMAQMRAAGIGSTLLEIAGDRAITGLGRFFVDEAKKFGKTAAKEGVKAGTKSAGQPLIEGTKTVGKTGVKVGAATAAETASEYGTAVLNVKGEKGDLFYELSEDEQAQAMGEAATAGPGTVTQAAVGAAGKGVIETTKAVVKPTDVQANVDRGVIHLDEVNAKLKATQEQIKELVPTQEETDTTTGKEAETTLIHEIDQARKHQKEADKEYSDQWNLAKDKLGNDFNEDSLPTEAQKAKDILELRKEETQLLEAKRAIKKRVYKDAHALDTEIEKLEEEHTQLFAEVGAGSTKKQGVLTDVAAKLKEKKQLRGEIDKVAKPRYAGLTEADKKPLRKKVAETTAKVTKKTAEVTAKGTLATAKGVATTVVETGKAALSPKKTAERIKHAYRRHSDKLTKEALKKKSEDTAEKAGETVRERTEDVRAFFNAHNPKEQYEHVKKTVQEFASNQINAPVVIEDEFGEDDQELAAAAHAAQTARSQYEEATREIELGNLDAAQVVGSGARLHIDLLKEEAERLKDTPDRVAKIQQRIIDLNELDSQLVEAYRKKTAPTPKPTVKSTATKAGKAFRKFVDTATQQMGTSTGKAEFSEAFLTPVLETLRAVDTTNLQAVQDAHDTANQQLAPLMQQLSTGQTDFNSLDQNTRNLLNELNTQSDALLTILADAPQVAVDRPTSLGSRQLQRLSEEESAAQEAFYSAQEADTQQVLDEPTSNQKFIPDTTNKQLSQYTRSLAKTAKTIDVVDTDSLDMVGDIGAKITNAITGYTEKLDAFRQGREQAATEKKAKYVHARRVKDEAGNTRNEYYVSDSPAEKGQVWEIKPIPKGLAQTDKSIGYIEKQLEAAVASRKVVAEKYRQGRDALTQVAGRRAIKAPPIKAKGTKGTIKQAQQEQQQTTPNNLQQMIQDAVSAAIAPLITENKEVKQENQELRQKVEELQSPTTGVSPQLELPLEDTSEPVTPQLTKELNDLENKVNQGTATQEDLERIEQLDYELTYSGELSSQELQFTQTEEDLATDTSPSLGSENNSTPEQQVAQKEGTITSYEVFQNTFKNMLGRQGQILVKTKKADLVEMATRLGLCE